MQLRKIKTRQNQELDTNIAVGDGYGDRDFSDKTADKTAIYSFHMR